uniref:Uncharacterized protein n=1 Tax=Oryza nivara TaxID=4536 RepID=A0A0E0H2E6_ORYNI
MIVLLLSTTVAISPVDEGKCSTKPQRLPAAIGLLWVRKQHQDQKATQKTGSSDQKATSSVCFRNSDQIYASTTLASSSVCPSSSALLQLTCPHNTFHGYQARPTVCISDDGLAAYRLAQVKLGIYRLFT